MPHAPPATLLGGRRHPAAVLRRGPDYRCARSPPLHVGPTPTGRRVLFHDRDIDEEHALVTLARCQVARFGGRHQTWQGARRSSSFFKPSALAEERAVKDRLDVASQFQGLVSEPVKKC